MCVAKCRKKKRKEKKKKKKKTFTASYVNLRYAITQGNQGVKQYRKNVSL